ncbi:hypothetical protein [Pseudoalteromonas sp. HM-SA03]|uniref:hypothetical protein n=1 Tax=Pseudoalteromonas sp. HM-SA03 TaxID=2029678 RepID=UPI0020D0512D|nr:hypothetical protein [Pseudoalteromonas sp. HM-SA03]
MVKRQSKGHDLQHQAATIPEQIHCKFPSIDKQKAQALIELLDSLNGDLAGSRNQ